MKKNTEELPAMLKSLRLTNFKAYKDSGVIPLKPLTILIGANNSGKSTILQALLMLKQSTEQTKFAGRAHRFQDTGSPLVTTGPDVDMKGFHAILRGGSKNKEGRFGIAVEIEEQFYDGKTIIPKRLKLDTVHSFDADAKETRFAHVSISGGKCPFEMDGIGGTWKWGDITSEQHKSVKPTFYRGLIPAFANQLVSRADGKTTVLEGPTGLVNDLAEIGSAFNRSFSSISSIPPLRKRTDWFIPAGARASKEFGAGGENLVTALASKLKLPQSDQTLVEATNDWVKRLELLKRVEVERVDERGLLRSLVGDEVVGMKGINLAAMGEGVSQVMPVISFLLGSSPRACLMVEQPELHLHPKMQTNLGDLFLYTTKHRKCQVIVETHSEHLLLRIRRRIAEGKTVGEDGLPLTPDDVAVLYVEKKTGGSVVRALKLEDSGNIEDWPDGFFDEAYQEALKMTMAAQGEPAQE